VPIRADRGAGVYAGETEDIMGRLGLILAFILALGIGQAQAHAFVTSSTPAPYAKLAPGMVAITLHYDDAVDPARCRLSLRGPQGEARLTIINHKIGTVLKAQTSLTAGAFEIHWIAYSTDGHITQGVIPFTVAAP
jgi:methionine-rich copper-binding protein CopC